MSTSLSRFARWATELRLEDLPEDVVGRARLQHLFTAGVIREVAGRGVAAGLRKSLPGRGKAALLVPGAESTSSAEGASNTVSGRRVGVFANTGSATRSALQPGHL